MVSGTSKLTPTCSAPAFTTSPWASRTAASVPKLSKSTKNRSVALFAAPTSTWVLVPTAASGSTDTSTCHRLAVPVTFWKFAWSLCTRPNESYTSKVVLQVPFSISAGVAPTGISGVVLSRLQANQMSVVAFAGSLLPTGMIRSSISAETLTNGSPPTVRAIQPCTRMPLAGFTSRPSRSSEKEPARV